MQLEQSSYRETGAMILAYITLNTMEEGHDWRTS